MCIFIFKHGFAKIMPPVEYPLNVDPNTPFDISYTVKNIGQVVDTICGYLTCNGIELDGSRWKKLLKCNQSISKNYRHPGLSDDATIVLKVGYS